MLEVFSLGTQPHGILSEGGKIKPEILAIIPARGGSRGVPRKNIKPLYGKPLIAYTIEAVLNAQSITRSILSTEDAEIAKIAKGYGVKVLKRSRELAQDETHIRLVLEDVVNILSKENYIPDIIVLLNPTSPLRRSEDIDGAISLFLNERYDTMFSAYPCHIHLWRREGDRLKANYDVPRQLRRQDTPPSFRENGAIYVIRRGFLLQEHKLLGGEMGMYIMRECDSIDIDTELDFFVAEALMYAIGHRLREE